MPTEQTYYQDLGLFDPRFRFLSGTVYQCNTLEAWEALMLTLPPNAKPNKGRLVHIVLDKRDTQA